MKTTLLALNSSYTHTNPAVRYLADSLEKKMLEVSILEFNLKDKHENILMSLYSQKSDVYAFSVYIWNRSNMLLLAKELKMLLPSAHIIFGGPEVSFETEEFFKTHPYIDTLISGEGESILPDICSSPSEYKYVCAMGRSDQQAFFEQSILYDKYPAKGDILYYESSRGCPHRCSYCLSSLTKGIYAKSAEKTLDDLLKFEKLSQKPRIIKFIDRTFNYDIERAKRIWKGLCSPEFTLNYHFEICADRLDEESFDILSKIPRGKIQLEAGIQSTNPKTLQSVNRNTDSKKATDNLMRIKNMGNIHIHADLIAGLPFEDMQSLKASFDDTIHCCHKLQLGFLKLLKGSKIRSQKKEHGYICSPEPPYTVLANKYISFEDMHMLKKTAEVIDRVYSSDRFTYFCEYLLKHSTSPFESFCEITKAAKKDIEKISQSDLRLILFEYAKSRFKGDEILERLALDSLIWENKNPPDKLKKYYTELGKEKEYNIYTFCFDKENRYYINRTKHTLIIKQF